MGLPVWGTPANFNGFRILVALLHDTLVVGVSQTLQHWTEGATYIWQSSHHVWHWSTFLVAYAMLGLKACDNIFHFTNVKINRQDQVKPRQWPEDDWSVIWQAKVIVATSLARMTSHFVVYFNHISTQITANKICKLVESVFGRPLQVTVHPMLWHSCPVCVL